MNVQELEIWFKSVELPKAPILLFPGTEIEDVHKFLESHFLALQTNPDSKSNVPIWFRLKAFKLLIESNL